MILLCRCVKRTYEKNSTPKLIIKTSCMPWQISLIYRFVYSLFSSLNEYQNLTIASFSWKRPGHKILMKYQINLNKELM